MNYRHAFHAGNFADVLKHAVLARIVTHLKQKETPFRVIDTHAGIARYDLAGDEASRTGEWRDGIGRLLGDDAEPLPTDVAAVLEPYLAVVRDLNGGSGALRIYPGSPLVARRLMRPQDRLVVNELHPADHRALAGLFAKDRQTKVMELDAWVALKALLPPKERRGIVLIDPPFEQPGEFDRLADGLVEAVKRFAVGQYVLWYPIKDPKPIAKFLHGLGRLGIDKLYRLELMIRAPNDPTRLNGCGLVVLNPPHPVTQEMPRVMDVLAARLALGSGAQGSAGWIVPERRS